MELVLSDRARLPRTMLNRWSKRTSPLGLVSC